MMKTELSIFRALVLCCLLASCGKETLRVPQLLSEPVGINFSSDIEAPENWIPAKAVNVDSNYLKTNGFGVYAYYTGNSNYSGASSVEGVVMENRKVWKGNDYSFDSDRSPKWQQIYEGGNAVTNWIYYGPGYPGYSAGNESTWKYKEYWPMKDGEKVTFFAYAPWNLWNTAVTTSGCKVSA